MNSILTNHLTIKVGNQNIWKVYLVDILVLVNVFINIFLPTSHNKVIYGLNRIIIVWIILLIEIMAFMLMNHVHKTRLFVSLVGINAYMLLATIITKISYPDARVSLARIAPIISLVILCSMKIKKYPNIEFLKFILNFVSITAIIWNSLIILGVSKIIDFTYNNYNQYYDTCGLYQLVLGHKPVMSFGVHTYASYFYFLLFILCYATYKKHLKTIYLFYCYMYAFFCVFCVSTTGIVFFLIMSLVLLTEAKRSLSIKTFGLIIFTLAVGLIVIYFNFNDLYSRLYTNITGGNHSFSARYSSSSSAFDANIEIIRSSLGIGYNIIPSLDLRYSDSGYLVYLTMGNIPLLIALYYNVFRFLNDNIQIYKLLVIVAVFGFELGLPGTFNYRFSYFIIFVVLYLGALNNSTNYNTPIE